MANNTQAKMLSIVTDKLSDVVLTKDDIGVAAKAADLKEFAEGVNNPQFPKYAKYVLNLQQIPAKKIKSGAKKIETLNGIEVSAMVKFCDTFEQNNFSKMDKPRGAIASKIITAMWDRIHNALHEQKVELFTNIPVLTVFNQDADLLIFLRFKNARPDNELAKKFIGICGGINEDDWANIPKSVRRFMDQRLLRAISFTTIKLKFTGAMEKSMQSWADYMLDEYESDNIMMEQIRKIKPRTSLSWKVEKKSRRRKSNDNNNDKEEEMS